MTCVPVGWSMAHRFFTGLRGLHSDSSQGPWFVSRACRNAKERSIEEESGEDIQVIWHRKGKGEKKCDSWIGEGGETIKWGRKVMRHKKNKKCQQGCRNSICFHFHMNGSFYHSTTRLSRKRCGIPNLLHSLVFDMQSKVPVWIELFFLGGCRDHCPENDEKFGVNIHINFN